MKVLLMLTSLKRLFLKRKPLSFMVIAIVIVGGVYKLWPAKVPLPEPPMLVEVETLHKRTLIKTVSLSGVVHPTRLTLFQAQEKGVMGPVLVAPGHRVKEGVLLAQMRNLKWQRAFEHARTKANLAETHYKRLKKLVANNTKSQRSLDIAHEAWLFAEIAVEETRKALARTQFKAPYEGTVGVFKAREGQALKEGDEVVAFYDASSYIIDIDVPDSLVGKIAVGRAFSTKNITGEITSVQGILDPKTHMALARAVFYSEGPVALGARIRVNVEVAHKDHVLTLPRSAVFLKEGKPAVYKIIDGKAELSFVSKGLEGGERFEITEGVSLGDQVILKGKGGIWPTKEVKAL